MLLALDVGNTNILAGLFDGGKVLKKTWRLSTHPVGTSDEFKIKIKNLCQMEAIDFNLIQAVVVSSVVPQSTAMLRGAFLPRIFNVIDSTWKYSFTIKASPAEQVGTDRLVNAEAVVREFGAPAIIVDSGTATTLCAISAKREYLGGAIMPGIELSIEALAKKAARLFSVELTPPQKAIGQNTEEALKSGILLGYASMIDGMIIKFKQELKAQGAGEVRVVATGGVSALLKDVATGLEIYDPDLTLKGIRYLYESLSR